MTMVPRKFRKKPVEVSAVQFLGGDESALSIVRWILDNGGRASYETIAMDEVTGVIGISTLEGRMSAQPGDYIIRGVDGEFYPCKPWIFEQTYEEASGFTISDANRMLIYRAYDDGDGNTVTLEQGDIEDWFVGVYEGDVLMSGVEINGVLYSVCLEPHAILTVLVGDEIVSNVVGPHFNSLSEARGYIQGLAAK